MRFVVRLLRHQGRVLSWREVINRPPRSGDLRVEERMDEELRRYVRIARLFDNANVGPGQVLPELLDVRLVVMSPQAFTLTGFERIDGTAYAQSWMITEREQREQ